MSQTAIDFVSDWVAHNIQATGYEPEDDNSEAKESAKRCMADALKMGVSKDKIEAEFGDLVGHMSEAIEKVNDAEVGRQAAQD